MNSLTPDRPSWASNLNRSGVGYMIAIYQFKGALHRAPDFISIELSLFSPERALTTSQIEGVRPPTLVLGNTSRPTLLESPKPLGLYDGDVKLSRIQSLTGQSQ